MDTTTVVLPGMTARVEPYLNLILEALDDARLARVRTRSSVDPITVEVIGSALASIVEEMGEALVRASYSTNIKERRDCSTALFDVDGQTLCQAEHIPMHLGSFIGIVAAYPRTPSRRGDAPGRRLHRQRRL